MKIFGQQDGNPIAPSNANRRKRMSLSREAPVLTIIATEDRKRSMLYM